MKVVHPGPAREVGVATPTKPERSTRVNVHQHARMTVHGPAFRVCRVREEARDPDAPGERCNLVPARRSTDEALSRRIVHIVVTCPRRMSSRKTLTVAELAYGFGMKTPSPRKRSTPTRATPEVTTIETRSTCFGAILRGEFNSVADPRFWKPKAHVDLGGQTTSGRPQRLGLGPVFPAAACWCTRTSHWFARDKASLSGSSARGASA